MNSAFMYARVPFGPPPSSMLWSAVYGIGATMSMTGWATARIGATTRSPSSIEPVQQITIPAIGLKCISGGTRSGCPGSARTCAPASRSRCRA